MAEIFYYKSINKATENYIPGKINAVVWARKLKEYLDRQHKRIERRMIFPTDYKLKWGENANKRASKAVSD